MRQSLRPAARTTIAAAIALGLLVAACGGGPSPSPAGTPSPTPSPATATPEATATPTASPTDGSGIDVSDAARAIENLSAYQLDVRIQGAFPGASALGDTVTVQVIFDRDNDAYQMTMSGAEGLPGELSVIVVGDDAWVDVGTGTYLEQPGGAATFGASVEGFAPEALLQSTAGNDLSGMTEIGEETKNGVATTHYRVEASSNPDLAEEIGEDGVFDIWIAKDGGFLVSMTMSGEVDADGVRTPMEMSLDISRLNDPAINITAPN